MKPLIISFASHARENYNQAQLNLIKSINNSGFECDQLHYSFDGYVDEYMGININNCKGIQFPQPKAFTGYPHSEVPYHFKPAIFQIAREKGYDQVIWCDSTIRVKKDLQPLLDIAKEQGIVVFDNLGHPIRQWISKECRAQMNVTDQELVTMPQIMACVIIFDFTNPKGVTIFDEWCSYANDGISFKNGTSERSDFKAHRHDQVVLSVLCNRNGIKMQPYGQLVYPPHDVNGEYGNDIYFVNKGIED